MNEFSDLDISRKSFGLYWKDADADIIGIDDTTGLVVALEHMRGPVYDIIAQLQNDEDHGRFKMVSFTFHFFSGFQVH